MIITHPVHCKEYNVAIVLPLNLLAIKAGDGLCHDRVAAMGEGPSS
jgi:hypothetical protein